MDFEQARQKHAEWRVRLRGAMTKKETFDVAAIVNALDVLEREGLRHHA